MFVVVCSAVTASVVVMTRSTGVDGHNLVSRNGEIIKVGEATKNVELLELTSGGYEILPDVKQLDIFYATEDNEYGGFASFEVSTRHLNEEDLEVCSAGNTMCVTLNTKDKSANYTDSKNCPKPNGCAVILNADQVKNRGRFLAWWNPASWFRSSSGPTPVWKATSSCPWICKQGWWWQSDAYGKPACCQETKDSGSPYDTCQYERCSCDASCRSCCN